MRTAILALAAVACVACTWEPTQVVVAVDTDLDARGRLVVRVTVRRGTGAVPVGSAPDRVLVREAPGTPDAGLVLPATFGLVPRPEGPRDEAFTVQIEATSDAQTVRRTVAMQFVPRSVQRLRVFLSSRCALRDRTCRGLSCTRVEFCESTGDTCDEFGECVPITRPPPLIRDAAAFDAPAMDTPATDVPAPDVPAPDVPAPDVAPDVPAPRCGDGVCNGDETACTCASDGCAPVCGDGCCNGGESYCACPGDRCVDPRATDPTNCGACGRTCISGACASSTCAGFGGMYEVGSTPCPHCEPNALVRGCGCPTSYPVSIGLELLNDCSGGLDGAVAYVCASSELAAGNFAGAFQLDDSVACGEGCRSPNQYTGGCSCPLGARALEVRALRSTGPCGIIGTTITFCVPDASPRGNFGGIYQEDDPVPGNMGCRGPNPYTGDCSCLAGFTAHSVRAIVDIPGSRIGSRVYYCVR